MNIYTEYKFRDLAWNGQILRIEYEQRILMIKFQSYKQPLTVISNS